MPITNQNCIHKEEQIKKIFASTQLKICFLPIHYVSVSQTFLLADPFLLWKITTDPHVLALVNIQCPDHRYPKLKIYKSKPILDSHEYITVAYVTKHCMIWP